MRKKINFDTVNGDNYEIISPEKIEESRVRIKKELRKKRIRNGRKR